MSFNTSQTNKNKNINIRVVYLSIVGNLKVAAYQDEGQTRGIFDKWHFWFSFSAIQIMCDWIFFTTEVKSMMGTSFEQNKWFYDKTNKQYELKRGFCDSFQIPFEDSCSDHHKSG